MPRNIIRMIAILLLSVYLPVSAFAATPYVWCVGEDGHSAIEFITPEGSHDTIPYLSNDSNQFRTAIFYDHREDCIDKSIAPTSLTYSKSPKSVHLPTQKNKFEDCGSRHLLTQVMSNRKTAVYLLSRPGPSFPSLQHIKTIKLQN